MCAAKSIREITIPELHKIFFDGLKGHFAMIETAYLDESSDASEKQFFLAAGFVCVDPEWKRLRREWRRILKPHNIGYFRSHDCRFLKGEFLKLTEKWGPERARKIADGIRKSLENVIDSSSLLMGFGMAVNLQDFREVDAMPEAQKNRQWMRDAHDYKTAAFRHIFRMITDVMVNKMGGDNYLTFICDESTHFKKIRRGYERMREKYPQLAERIISLAPMDDQRVPQLQMADLMADVANGMMRKSLNNAGARITPEVIETRVATVDYWGKIGMLKTLRGEIPGP